MLRIEKTETRTYYIEKSKKFDTISVELTFSQILNKLDVAKRNLVSQVLIRAVENFPTKLATRAYLADLYAARVSSGVGKNGGMHEVTIQFTFVDPQVANDDAYTMDTIFDCIRQILLTPALEEGIFQKKLVDVEKRVMQEKINQLYDDKMHYAQLQLVEKMFANTPFAIKAYGEVGDYDTISAADVYASYLEMLAKDTIDVYAIGDFEISVFERALDSILANTQQEAKTIELVPYTRETEEAVETYIEKQVINQTKLHIGYKIPVTIESPNYIQQKLAIDVFGGGTQSKLFQEVREKASLAYYASASMDAYAQAMYVYAGIDEKNAEKAQAIIDKQIECMQQGEITDEELTIAIITATHRLSAIQDTQGGCIMLHRTLSRLAGIETIEQWQDALKRVTKADVVQAAKTWKKDTVFMLVPEESNETENEAVE